MKITGRSPVLDRIADKTEFTDDCWNWTGAKYSYGYGRIMHDGKTRSVHRLVYELTVGPVDKSLDLDHLCRNRACINPDHLEPVTRRTNLTRGDHPNMVIMRENRCKAGHDLVGDNVRYRKDGRKVCRACRNRMARDWYAKNKTSVWL